jgi:hypothetical protein
MGEQMVVADMDMVETHNKKLSDLRQRFFEHPDGGKLASDTLPHIIGDLRTYASYGSKQSKRVLGLALHLSSILSCYRMDYGTCLQESNEMINYAHDLGDIDMEAAALIQQGMLSYYAFRPSLRHATFRRAMHLLKEVQSPLIHARVLYGYAESIAASGQVELDGVQRYFEAEGSLERAESVLISENDPGHTYIRWNHVTQAIHRARFLVARRKCDQAVELLTDISSREATPLNVEVLSMLAQAYCHMILRRPTEDSFERTCFFLSALVDASQRMGSRLHHSLAQTHYELLMRSKWHREFSKRLLHVVAF